MGSNAVKGCREAYLVLPCQQQHSRELQKGRWLGQGLSRHRWTPTCSPVGKVEGARGPPAAVEGAPPCDRPADDSVGSVAC